MKFNKSAILPLAITVLTVGYGSLDYCGAIDEWRGRTAAMHVWERLSTVATGDSVIMFDDEAGFRAGSEFIVKRCKNPIVTATVRKGEKPTAIARLGGIDMPPMTGPLREWDGVSKFYASPNSPVGVMFDSHRQGKFGIRNFSLCILGEIPEWVNRSRENERFWVYTGLIGLLSLVVAASELRKSP